MDVFPIRDGFKAIRVRLIRTFNSEGLMSGINSITMFDHVRVRSAPETEALGVAGLMGQVYGET